MRLVFTYSRFFWILLKKQAVIFCFCRLLNYLSRCVHVTVTHTRNFHGRGTFLAFCNCGISASNPCVSHFFEPRNARFARVDDQSSTRRQFGKKIWRRFSCNNWKHRRSVSFDSRLACVFDTCFFGLLFLYVPFFRFTCRSIFGCFGFIASSLGLRVV